MPTGTLEKLAETFQDPKSLYRGAPFWAWNGRLEPEELRRQIRIMRRMGLGGFFMHSRVGLDTAYLSDQWFECVEACIDEAKKLGMNAWLYDEDRWPSGAAGGIVTKAPKYRMRSLVMREIAKARDFRWHAGVLAAFAGRVDGHEISGLRPLARRAAVALSPGETILEFTVQHEPLSPWYNGYGYLDTLNPKAVARFIEVTYEAYRRRIGKEFGRCVPGIFTDEPNYGSQVARPDWAQGYTRPWTQRLPAVFRERYGYDLMPRLPELFFDVDGQAVSQARYHYTDCATHLFVDSFSRQIGEWCGRNGLAFTGHVLGEDQLSSQTNVVGSCMRFYEHMQIPGMDQLTEQRRIWDTAKQLSSAARQFGRRWRLTETYGCTGWDFPFAGHKATGDWQAALGVNVNCPHLAWYTMEGEAKRDYPAGIFYQSPWWDVYSKVEDHHARVHSVMARGEDVRDLLVIHPIESMWLLFRKGRGGRPEEASAAARTNPAAQIREYDQMFIDLRDSLLAANLDFDYGDEELLSRHGRVVKKTGLPILFMGKAAYKGVVVPPLLTMRRSTLDLLRRFRQAGGHVVFAGDAAQYVDALPSAEPADFARECECAPASGPALAAAVEPFARRVSITDGGGREIVPALHLLKEDKDAFYLFVCNTGHDFLADKLPTTKDFRVQDRTLAFPDVRVRGFGECKGSPIEMDPDTGEMFAADAAFKDGRWEIRTNFPPLGSRLFLIPKRADGRKFARRKSLRTVGARPLGAGAWPVALSEDNNLTLDRARFKIGDGPWQEAEEILRVDRAVRAALGIAPRGGQMVQPWARKATPHPKCIPLALEYAFEVKTIPSGALSLAIERPGTFEIRLNGQLLDTETESGWWVDRSLRRVPFDPALLKLGRNTLLLTCRYPEDHPGLEIIYLLGKFGVTLKGTQAALTAAPAALKLGDWGPQGLTFYSGSVSYQTVIHPRLRKGDRLFVEVPEYRGAAVRIWVDGKPAGVIGWEPNELEITDFVKGASALLQIEVLGHRRNSHGPFHFFEKWPEWTGPGQYVSKDKWFEGYQLVPCGLMKPPRLAVRR